MRELLDAVAAGELSPADAEARLRGYATTGAGRFDAARRERSGVPEAILASEKTAADVAALAATAIETTGRAIVTRADRDQVAAVRDRLDAVAPAATLAHHPAARTLVAHAPTFDPPRLDATVAIATGGTADRGPATEASLIAREMGARIRLIEDVGVASLARTVDAADRLRDADVVIVAAGREGALPTVIAGLIDSPVIGLPIAAGYGRGGEGEAALDGLLQSCTALSVVNVDAGFTAGVQAGLIARSIDAARGA
ncbi:nickel pincer cofactor biosynthesis protein LarB [Halococcoides cellulosivorans]|uniref:Nickel pincer cofactor biosynthesis protein LarB n=1 Tax=Halococcoides cellulosivorans TaxID=1679096 RepID=A0A2R4WYB7_9EURY|nr:nickel pincer cofactor biosynthesis protein LarB [Halococcoides cellulosivorans]AWB26539.1 nickel pincer cofactor biosynthesis protein LarB [Halococcoides cellulosivorans]